MGTELAAAIAAIASAVALVITSLRKRKDDDMGDLQQRVKSLEAQVDNLEGTVADLRRELLAAEGENFTLRRILVHEGIPNPFEATP